MGRRAVHHVRVLALFAALALAQGCQEGEQLKREAPALAHANLRIDRIAIAGVVSEVGALADSDESRANWSVLIGDHFARDRFGGLPIVSFSDVREMLGEHDHIVLLDRFKGDGECGEQILADLNLLFGSTARFVVFGNILEDDIERSESESEVIDEKTKKVTSRIKTMSTSRTTTVRLRFYDLSDKQLAWDHLAIGRSSVSKQHDMTDIVEHDPKEGFLGGLLTSVVNSTLKPDPKYPPAPGLESSLSCAFDDVGAYLKPSKKR
ncbi:MAG: hypothetical protein ACRENS_03930 [Candidatus Eiseniibacteriota bacterium]